MSDLISRQAVIDALKVAYWDKDIQSAKDDPCIVDAMTDWAIRQVKNLPSANRPQGWIPCSERLPKYRELVDVTTRDLRVKLAYLDSIEEDGTDDLWVMPLEDAECALWNITAWMPLPKPWKGEGDD